MSIKKLILPVLLSCLISACFSSKPPSMMASTSPVPPGVRGTVPAYGSDCQYFLLGLIPVSFSPNTDAAITDAKRSSRTEVLTDVTVDYGSFYWILFSTQCVRVRGKGIPPEVLSRAQSR